MPAMRHDDPMHVLTTRGGELAAPFGPICTNDECRCAHGLASLESKYPAEIVTVAEQDITLEGLTAACADFLARAGWTDEDGELAADMAAGALEAAAGFPVGTRLRPRFDHAEECWTFTPEG
jgi:hypothetical protein